MFIEAQHSKEEIFLNIQEELRRATVDKKHPFRYTVLGSIRDNSVQTRYVVLRRITEKLEFLLYTDYRSAKCKEFLESASASLLFYHPSKKLQIRINGSAFLHLDDDLAKQEWAKVQGEATNAYTSSKAPGSEISEPEMAYKCTDPENENYFAVIRIEVRVIEALQLNRSEHLRIQYLLNEGQKIRKAQWLIP